MAKETLPVIPTSKEIAKVKGQVLAVQQAAYQYVITTSADLTRGEEMLKAIKQIETRITSRKEEITRPLMQALASARDLYKPLETGHAEAKKVIKEKMLAFQIEEDARIAAAQAKIEARVEKGTMRADTAAGKMEAIEIAKPKLNTRTLVKVRVIDETAIPREYLMPNMTTITEAILRKNIEVPGVERYEEKVIVTK